MGNGNMFVFSIIWYHCDCAGVNTPSASMSFSRCNFHTQPQTFITCPYTDNTGVLTMITPNQIFPINRSTTLAEGDSIAGARHGTETHISRPFAKVSATVMWFWLSIQKQRSTHNLQAGNIYPWLSVFSFCLEFIFCTFYVTHKPRIVHMFSIIVQIKIKKINLSWRNEAIWRKRSDPKLAPALACCLTAPNH